MMIYFNIILLSMLGLTSILFRLKLWALLLFTQRPSSSSSFNVRNHILWSWSCNLYYALYPTVDFCLSRTIRNS